MTRFSPVREVACNAIVGRFDPGPRLRPACGPDGQGSPLLREGRRFESAQAGLVFTLWQGRQHRARSRSPRES
jgi:hypothetical protein